MGWPTLIGNTWEETRDNNSCTIYGILHGTWFRTAWHSVREGNNLNYEDVKVIYLAWKTCKSGCLYGNQTNYTNLLNTHVHAIRVWRLIQRQHVFPNTFIVF